VAERILASRPHPQQGFQACRGLIRLGEAYGNERLEAACERALAINAASYKTVNEILKQNLDKLPLPKPKTSTPAIAHDNVRWRTITNPKPRPATNRPDQPKGATLMLTNPTLDKLQRLR
jgi:transposase